MGVEELGQGFHARAEGVFVEVIAQVTVELHMGKMGPPAGQATHRLEKRAPVPRQAQVRRVHVEWMG